MLELLLATGVIYCMVALFLYPPQAGRCGLLQRMDKWVLGPPWRVKSFVLGGIL